MKKYWKEKLKFIILVILVLTSIIQVGIRWNGLPAFFGAGNADTSQKLDEAARAKIFTPYRISASDGSGKHWVIQTSDSNYKLLWDDSKAFLRKVMVSSSSVLDGSEWSDLVTRKTFLLDFRTGIDLDLASWFLNVDLKNPRGPDKIYKILISPWEEANYNTIYIFDGISIYKYVLSYEKISRKSYDNIIVFYQNNNSNSDGMIGNNKMPFSIRPDILGITSKSKIKDYQNLICNIPNEIKDKGNYSSSDLLGLAKNILGSDVYSFDRTVDSDDKTVKFSTVNNTYSVYNDGLLEYKSLQTSSQDSRGRIDDAFRNAYRLINNVKVFNSNTDIYLSGVKQEKDRYVFTFNYTFDEYPIFFQYKSGALDKVLTDAITIEANESNVLSCEWILRSFSDSNENNAYNASLRDFFNIPDKTFKTLRSDKSIIITDIVSSYVVKSNSDNIKLLPSWVISTTGKNYFIPMEG